MLNALKRLLGRSSNPPLEPVPAPFESLAVVEAEPAKPLTLATLVERLKANKDQFEDLVYAYSQLDTKNPLPDPYRKQSIEFAQKAEFGLGSFHDTVKLGLEAVRIEKIRGMKGNDE